MKNMCADLAKEQKELDAIVADLDETAWNTRTPAVEWTIKDQIRHLAYYEERARLAASDPEVFKRWLAGMLQNLDEFRKHVDETGKDLSAKETLNWWREERRELLEILKPMDRKHRLHWYGPDMSAMSFATARLMETWAHGQDIADALGVIRKPTDRLRHIAHLGVGTFAWSFANRQMDVPDKTIRVELRAPSGDLWVWGPPEATDSVKGSAEDFCLVVVQRCHFADTNLILKGETAKQWMAIAQCYAGPPGQGRKPGVLPKRNQ